MYMILLVFHVLACLILISVILLQAGRGVGLNEAFGGGGGAQSVLGTQAPAILKKATTISAIAFLVTSLLLGAMTARRGKSLFMRGGMPDVSGMTIPGSMSTRQVVEHRYAFPLARMKARPGADPGSSRAIMTVGIVTRLSRL